MHNFFRNQWRSISNIGLSESTNPDIRRIIGFTNRLTFFIFVLLLGLFIYNHYQLGWTTFNKSLLIGNAVIMLLLFTLNKLRLFSISRIFLSWMISFYPFITSVQLKLSDPFAIEEAMYFMPRFFIIATAVIPVLVFSFKEKRLLALALMGSFIPLFFFDPIHHALQVGYYQVGFDSMMYPTFNVVTLGGYILLLLATIFFKRTNEQYEDQNLKLIQSLKNKNHQLIDKNAEIESQSKELELANYEIRLMNEKLESVANNRTKKLMDQAIRFQLYAFKNSHELRAPLTTLMGVIELLNDSKSPAQTKELLGVLRQSCLDLDKVIHDINEVISDAVNQDDD